MFRFSIRDLLWLTLVMAAVCTWQWDKEKTRLELVKAKTKEREALHVAYKIAAKNDAESAREASQWLAELRKLTISIPAPRQPTQKHRQPRPKTAPTRF